MLGAVAGAEGAERTIAAPAKAARRVGGFRSEPVGVNGQPGARTLTAEGALVNVFEVEIADGRVQAMRSIVNPDKLAQLAHLAPVADLSALLGD